MATSLLPPQATPFERALELAAAARLEAVDLPFETLKDPAHCPVALLPFLAWEWGAEGWDADWSEATKRAAVANAIALARIRGSRQCVEDVVARHDALASLVEWFETVPHGTPGTFDVIVPIGADDEERGTADFARAIIVDVIRHKPLSAHFALVQALTSAYRIGAQAALRVSLFAREAVALVEDTSQPWADLLTDENGEPLEDDFGTFLDVTP
ncbi:MAG: phage tail protein I [Sphingomonas sp.]|nr:phage tail protein I [Sphingomonas sp.]